jgi:hypothetical protein
MAEPDPYAGWPLSDRLQMLAFEAELAHLPRFSDQAIGRDGAWVTECACKILCLPFGQRFALTAPNSGRSTERR